MRAHVRTGTTRARAPPEAVIVAGGFGTRLLPLTARRPKHLLEVGGVPFLEHQISRLAEAGVGTSCSRRRTAPTSSSRCSATAAAGGSGSTTSRRTSRSGTGGRDPQRRRRALRDDPDGAVVILNGDILSGHDLARAARRTSRPRATAARSTSRCTWSRSRTRAPFGCVPTDAAGPGHRLRREVRQPGDPADQRRLLRLPPPRDRRRSRPAGWSRSSGRPSRGWSPPTRWWSGFVENAYWRDVGTPEALVAASRDLVLGIGAQPGDRPGTGAGRRRPRRDRRRAAPRSTAARGQRRRAVVEAGAVVRGRVLMAGAVGRRTAPVPTRSSGRARWSAGGAPAG